MTEKIQWLPIQKLEAHPNNPRLIIKDDVYQAILDSIKADGFQVCYALLVRPCKDKYQVISGHTRLKASNEANLTKIPCWVKEMSDDEAFFELVKANNQGELYPLEIGLHALQYIEMSNGGRGKKGVVSEYARQVGKGKSTLSKYLTGAKVLQRIKCSDVRTVLNKVNHLSQISKTPEPYWQTLTELLIDKEWTVKQTEEICRAVREWLEPDKAIKKTILEQKHRQWIESRASNKAKKELIESQKREKLERELQYAP